MAHTPGPWIIASRYGNMRTEIQAPKADRAVAEVWTHAPVAGDYLSLPEGEANCRLIAAAPDLLAELRGWLAIFDKDGAYRSPLVNAAIESTHEAISKAVGRDTEPLE